MKVKEVFQSGVLEDSFLIGYYGGGNYGDELLLEVLMNMAQKNGIKTFDVMYQKPAAFGRHHHDFGYRIVPAFHKPLLLKTIFKRKNLIIGGGGQWGLDVNFNIFLMSAMLFFARFFLGKKIYLLGVGYYNSTTPLGHMSAWLAGKAANVIIARDDETRKNFQKVKSQVYQDSDIAWNMDMVDEKLYKKDLAALEKRLPLTKKALFMTLRRFRPGKENNFTNIIAEVVHKHGDKPMIVALLEPADVDPENYQRLKSWALNNKHVQVIDFSYNPLALYLFFKKHHKQLVLISPQFHAIITAWLTGAPFFPVVYDNKVKELCEAVGITKTHSIYGLSPAVVQTFIAAHYSV